MTTTTGGTSSGGRWTGRRALVALSGVLLFGLAACDQDEQGRVLQYQPGVYLGEADQPLDGQQVEELEKRLQLQAGAEPDQG